MSSPLALPAAAFKKVPSGDGYHLVSVGNIAISERVCVLPVADDQPVLTADDGSTFEDETVFRLHGYVTLQLLEDTCRFVLEGTLRAVRQSDGSFEIRESAAESVSSNLNPAQNISTTACRVLLCGCRYQAQLHLRGTVHFHNDTVSAGGILDAPLQLLPGSGNYCSITTLLTRAEISIPPAFDLREGTIRFSLCSPNSIQESSPLPFDEDEELLFQITDPVALGPVKIEGAPGIPLTLWAELQPSATASSRLLLHCYPARLRTPCTGPLTDLFVHGQGYDEPFTIDPSGPWNARISSNVFLHLTTPDDTGGKSLLKSAVFVIGELNGNGLQMPQVSLSAESPMQAILFPDSPYARTLPDQQLDCRFSPAGEPELSLECEAPLALDEGARILPQEATGGSRILCRLCRQGLSFENVRVQKSADAVPVAVGRCIVNGDARILLMEVPF